MKLKTVPKIRADCISCNGDSSVRIRDSINEDINALPHVDVAVDSEDTAEVELLGWGVLGLPQRKIFGNKEAKVFLYGKYEVVPSFGISVYPLHCRMWEQLILKALRQWAVRVLLNVNKRN